jgi:hypothetical protein
MASIIEPVSKLIGCTQNAHDFGTALYEKKTMPEEYVSTEALAKKLNVDAFKLFINLKNINWIIRENDKWLLTGEGQKNGGRIKKNEKNDECIVWPNTITIDMLNKELEIADRNLQTVSVISEKINLSPQNLNLIFSELGWIERDIRGWNITELGRIAGGRQREHAESSKLYVMWPRNILENKSLIETLIENHILESEKTKSKTGIDNNELSFREKFPATFRTSDGHYVRSRAEVIIDNFLYNYQITHAYERKVPIEEELYCDFYIPLGKKVVTIQPDSGFQSMKDGF